MREKKESELFLGHYLMFLSQTWVASIYEVVRLLYERDKSLGENFRRLYEVLTIVRVPLEKHEIASERKLTKPLPMITYPPKNNGNEIYLYLKENSKRSVILPMSISKRGSAMWCVPDIKAQTSIWIERRNLSEQFLEIWGI
jgi:hypothetical protein